VTRPPSVPLLLALGALAAAPAPSPTPPGPAPAASPGVLHFQPRARGGSSYELQSRVGILTQDVTFDVPQAYRESFAFWSDHMKGQERSELYRFVLLTDDPAADGSVTYHRSVSRFQVEMAKNGEPLEPMTNASRDMPSLGWDGTLDPFGNVRAEKLVAGKNDPDMEELARPYAERPFPRVEGPRDLLVGEALKISEPMPPPSRMHIDGLESIGVVITRELTLRSFDGARAVFDVKTTYAADPARASTLKNTTCAISGSAKGEMVFDARRGVFESSREEGTMVFDIRAPLRPLPEHPETAHAGSGASHLALRLNVSAQQTVHKILGPED
jgi:hypothetical protein